MPANVDVKRLLHVHGFSPEMAEIPVAVYESFARLGKVKEVLAFRTRTTSKNHLFVEFATPQEADAARGKYAGGWQGDPVFPRSLMPLYEAIVNAKTSPSSSFKAASGVRTYCWDGKAPIVPELLPPSVGSISLSRMTYSHDNAYRSRHGWNESFSRNGSDGQGVGIADDFYSYEARLSSRDMGGGPDNFSSNLGYKHESSSQNGIRQRGGYVHGTWHDGKWLKNWESSGTHPRPYPSNHPRVRHEHESNHIAPSESYHASENVLTAAPMRMQTSWRPLGPRVGSLYSDRLVEEAASLVNAPKHSRIRHPDSTHCHISGGIKPYQEGDAEQGAYRHNHRHYNASSSQKSHHYYSYHHDQHHHHHRHESKHEKRHREADEESSERRRRSKREKREHSPTKSRSERAYEPRKHSSRTHPLGDDAESKSKLAAQKTHFVDPQKDTNTIKVENDTDTALLGHGIATEAAAKQQETVGASVLGLVQPRAVDAVGKHEPPQSEGKSRLPPSHGNWKEQGSSKVLGAPPAIISSCQNLAGAPTGGYEHQPQGVKEICGNHGMRRPSITFSAFSTGSRNLNESLAGVRAQGLPSVSSSRMTPRLSTTTDLHTQRPKGYAGDEGQKRYGTENGFAAAASEHALEYRGKDEEPRRLAPHATHTQSRPVISFHDWYTTVAQARHAEHENDGSSTIVQERSDAELYITEINHLRQLYSTSQAELLAERAAKRRAEDETDKERAIRRTLEDEVWALRVKDKLG